MAEVITRQSAENTQYIRQLLREKQPGFAVTLELAVLLVEQDLLSPGIPSDTSASDAS
jgi:hypothetical protein